MKIFYDVEGGLESDDDEEEEEEMNDNDDYYSNNNSKKVMSLPKNFVPEFTVQDSSRPGKISFHIIFDNIIFDDIYYMKEVLAISLLGLDERELDKNLQAQSRYIEILEGIDYSVYNRDRCFRFCYSRKHKPPHEKDEPHYYLRPVYPKPIPETVQEQCEYLEKYRLKNISKEDIERGSRYFYFR